MKTDASSATSAGRTRSPLTIADRTLAPLIASSDRVSSGWRAERSGDLVLAGPLGAVQRFVGNAQHGVDLDGGQLHRLAGGRKTDADRRAEAGTGQLHAPRRHVLAQ